MPSKAAQLPLGPEPQRLRPPGKPQRIPASYPETIKVAFQHRGQVRVIADIEYAQLIVSLLATWAIKLRLFGRVMGDYALSIGVVLLACVVASLLAPPLKSGNGRLFTTYFLVGILVFGLVRAFFVSPWLNRREEAREIRILEQSNQLFGVLAIHYPIEYAGIRERIRQIGGTKTYVEANGPTGVMTRLKADAIRRCEDKHVVEVINANLGIWKALAQLNEDSCFLYMTGQPVPLSRLVADEVLMRLQDAIANTLVNAAGRSQMVMPKSDAERIWAAILADLAQHHPKAIQFLDTGGANVHPSDRRAYCQMIIGLFERISALPTAEAAGVYRAFLI